MTAPSKEEGKTVSPPERVAVNAAIVAARPSGLGVVARELARRLSGLSPEVLVFGGDPAFFPGARFHPVPVWAAAGGGLGLGGLPRFLWIQLALPFRLRRLGVGRLLSPNHELVLFCPCPQVALVLDLLPLLFPECYPRQRFYYRHVFPRALRLADKIVTVSENTKGDLVRHYGLPPERIVVVPLGVDAACFRPGLGRKPPVPFVLSVGNQYPYKNLSRLLEAFAGLGREGLPHELVIAGGEQGGAGGELRRRAALLGISDKVRFMGYVPDERLAELYNQADLFVFPSLYEGFGLPALEAMACGCPVAAADNSSLPEVCGDAAVYFNPEDPAQMTAAMARTLKEPAVRRKLSSAGLERARRFSWEASARGCARLLGIREAP